MQRANIFDIKRYAINDGPGIRIVIFVKGCNLNCAWCHNPESISPVQERLYARGKCIRCGTCIAVCPENAITLYAEGINTDTELCHLCGKCTDVCPTKALEMSGKSATVDQIMIEIEKERVFFEQSGGGVTFSGGEPLLHSDFLNEILDECGKRKIHRAIDTAGRVQTEILLDVAKRTDLFLYDLKMMDSEKHRQWTGAPNKKILDNLKLLAETGADIIIRIPLIGGINDDEKNLTDTAQFTAALSGPRKKVNLLPYHKIGQTKYEKLNRPSDFILMKEPTHETQLRAIKIFQEYGILASISG